MKAKKKCWEGQAIKRRNIIILSVIAVIILGGVFGASITISNIEKNLNKLTMIEIEEVDLSHIEDGTYTGSYKVFPVSAEVTVTVKTHKITGIKLIKHVNGQGAAAESIPDEVVKTGSLQVDTVSGATYSSKVILKAIENALNNASNP